MQVGASAGLSAQLQVLENAAQGKSQDGQSFDAVLQMMNDATSTADSNPSGGAINFNPFGTGSTAGGDQGSGKIQMRGLIAVGSKSSDGQITPYSTQQLQSEKAEMNKVGATAYADALQNFMTLSQASGQAATVAGMGDPSQFVTSLGSGTVYDSFAETPSEAGMS